MSAGIAAGWAIAALGLLMGIISIARLISHQADRGAARPAPKPPKPPKPPKSPASPAAIHPSAFVHRTSVGHRSAQILTDGAETHNLRVAELTEAWHEQHRTVCAHCIDRDTGERYILTATRISHADGTPDVDA